VIIFSETRILCPQLKNKVMSAEQAAAFINDGDTVSMSVLPAPVTRRPCRVPWLNAQKHNVRRGNHFQINLWTGASTAPELDGALAAVDGINMRLPFKSDPVCRKQINNGQMHYIDIHLSEVS